MDISRIIYLIFLSLCFLISFVSNRKQNELKIFRWLLGWALITEVIAIVLLRFKLNFHWPYHAYIPLEYSLWAGYFYFITETPTLRKVILTSIPVFALVSLFLSIRIVPLNQFPAYQLNLEGILLVIWSVIGIFNIKVINNRSIFSLPVFWICTGVLIYYTGISSFMSVYNFISLKHTHLLSVLQVYLLIIPNYVLYTCLSIAFLCSRRIRK